MKRTEITKTTKLRKSDVEEALLWFIKSLQAVPPLIERIDSLEAGIASLRKEIGESRAAKNRAALG